MFQHSRVSSRQWCGIVASAIVLGVLSPTPRRLDDVATPSLTPARTQARDHMIGKLRTKQVKRFDQPQEALSFYWSKRSPDGQPVAVSEFEEAAAAAAELPLFSSRTGTFTAHTTTAPLTGSGAVSSPSGTLSEAWQPLGPGNIGGRSRAVLIHRTQNHLMWTAGVAGGIWKSTDSGASWQPEGRPARQHRRELDHRGSGRGQRAVCRHW